MGDAGDIPEFDVKPPLGVLLLVFSLGYLLNIFPQRDTSTKQRGFDIRVFLIIGELLKAIEPHLPDWQLYRWHLGPNKWSSPTTKLLDPIVATAPTGGLPSRKPRTRRRWISLQLSSARGVASGSVTHR